MKDVYSWSARTGYGAIATHGDYVSVARAWEQTTVEIDPRLWPIVMARHLALQRLHGGDGHGWFLSSPQCDCIKVIKEQNGTIG